MPETNVFEHEHEDDLAERGHGSLDDKLVIIHRALHPRHSFIIWIAVAASDGASRVVRTLAGSPLGPIDRQSEVEARRVRSGRQAARSQRPWSSVVPCRCHAGRASRSLGAGLVASLFSLSVVGLTSVATIVLFSGQCLFGVRGEGLAKPCRRRGRHLPRGVDSTHIVSARRAGS
jgi:hypothetical protein